MNTRARPKIVIGSGKKVGELLFEGVQSRDCASKNFLGRATGWDGKQQIALAIVVGQRRGAAFVGVHANTHGIGLVILALNEAAAAMIAYPGRFRWQCFRVEDGLALFAGSSTAQTGDNFFNRQIVTDGGIQSDSQFEEQLVQYFCLRHCSGKAIKQDAAIAAQAAGALSHHFQNRCVWNQITMFHESQRRRQSRTALALTYFPSRAEDVAGGQLART
ncbi:MAG: hypothetical protein RLY20_172 [Verrucomicrobiota bacterium]